MISFIISLFKHGEIIARALVFPHIGLMYLSKLSFESMVMPNNFLWVVFYILVILVPTNLSVLIKT